MGKAMGDFLLLCSSRRLAALPSRVRKGRYGVLWGLTLEYNLNWKLSRYLKNASSTFLFPSQWRLEKLANGSL